MNKVMTYDTKNKSLKLLTFLNMIWNYDHFSIRNIKFGKMISTLSNNSYVLKKSQQSFPNVLVSNALIFHKL